MKRNIFMGQASGKLGSMVLYVDKGEQRARVHTVAGGRRGSSASKAARLQRIAFGAAASEWRGLKYICSDLYRRGKKTNESWYNYFVRRNQKFLPYFSKYQNQAGVFCMMPGYYTEGSLGLLDVTLTSTGSGQSIQANLKATGYTSTSTATGASTMAELKDVYKEMFPAADKVTLVLGVVNTHAVGGSANYGDTQSVLWVPIIIDLYASESSDTQKVTDYLKAHGMNKISWLNTTTDEKFQFGGNNIVSIGIPYTGPEEALNTFILPIVTSDRTKDCYTTYINPSNAAAQSNWLKLWAANRTSDAAEFAANSYGYASVVLQDQILDFDSYLGDLVAAYINDLAAGEQGAALTLADMQAMKAKIMGEFKELSCKQRLGQIELLAKEIEAQAAEEPAEHARKKKG